MCKFTHAVPCYPPQLQSTVSYTVHHRTRTRTRPLQQAAAFPVCQTSFGVHCCVGQPAATTCAGDTKSNPRAVRHEQSSRAPQSHLQRRLRSSRALGLLSLLLEGPSRFSTAAPTLPRSSPEPNAVTPIDWVSVLFTLSEGYHS